MVNIGQFLGVPNNSKSIERIHVHAQDQNS